MLRTLSFATGIFLCATLPSALWAAEKGNAAKGKATFEQCAMCHNVDTPEKKMGPSLQGLFKHKMLANGKPVNEANVSDQINNGGGGMPAYGDQLSAEEKANILAYLHSL